MNSGNNEAGDMAHLQRAASLAGLRVSTVALPREHQVIANSMRIRYREWGDRQQPMIVFLHGGGLSAHTWDLTCLALQGDYHCIAIDQRGHGESEWSAEMDYTVEANVADLEAVLETIGVAQFFVVGMSMGGTHGVAYAAAHPEAVAGLVVVDTGTTVRPGGASRITRFMEETAELNSPGEFVERALQFNGRRDPSVLSYSIKRNLRRLPNGKWIWKYDQRHRSRADLMNGIRESRTRAWARATSVGVPTLVVRGGESDVLLKEDAEETARAFRNGQLVSIDGAGHSVQGDNVAAFVGALREFVDTQVKIIAA
jgi:esterase